MLQGQMRSVFFSDLGVLGLVLVDSVLNLVPVVFDQPLDGPGCSIAQSTNSVPFDLLSQLPEHVDFSVICLSDLKSTHSVSQPTSTLSAWSALTTTFVLVKLAETQDRLNYIGRLIHHDDSSST